MQKFGMATLATGEQRRICVNRLGTIALGAGAAAMAGTSAFGEISYQVLASGDQGFFQQAGNAAQRYGDDVLFDGVKQQILTVQIQFAFYTYDPATYTPDVEVDLYNVDSNGVPVGGPIATASNNSVTFTGSNYNNGSATSNAKQVLSFDFSAQTGAQNLEHFAFAYRDNNPDGYVFPGFGFSVYISSFNANPGTSGAGILVQDNFNNWSAGVSLGGGGASNNIEATIITVPEPATFGLLSLGILAALRRRKH